MTLRRWYWGAAIGLLGTVGVLLGTVPYDSADVVRVGPFSEMVPGEGFSNGWQSVSMAAGWDTTSHSLVRTDRGVVVRAHSEGGASGLGTRCRVDLAEYPILEWSWKPESIVESGDLRVKVKNDVPARIYIDFDYDDLGLYRRLKLVTFRALGFDAIPTRSINYVWGNRAPVDSVIWDPLVEWLPQMVVRSGTTHVGTWVTERRNVRADYRRIYGEDPPPVRGVAILTDTDATGGAVTTYYGDITFRARRPDSTRPDTRSRDRPDQPGETN